MCTWRSPVQVGLTSVFVTVTSATTAFRSSECSMGSSGCMVVFTGEHLPYKWVRPPLIESRLREPDDGHARVRCHRPRAAGNGSLPTGRGRGAAARPLASYSMKQASD
jgi:hypothetical protein